MSRRAPVIGITMYGEQPEGAFSLPAAYVRAVRRAGGIPILIPPGESQLDALLAQLDGVILAGGGDIDPIHYRGTGHETIYNLDAERDACELALARQIFAQQTPLLAICRGLQVVNVARGGTLHPHLPDVVGESVLHREPPRRPTTHTVTCDASRLADVVQAREFACQSWHHQAIDRPGDGCRVIARAPDGVVEAVELTDHPHALVVQWHPELSAEHDPAQQRLFDQLVTWAAELSARSP